MSDQLTVRLTLSHDEVQTATISTPRNHKVLVIWCAALVALICIVMGLLWQKLQNSEAASLQIAPATALTAEVNPPPGLDANSANKISVTAKPLDSNQIQVNASTPAKPKTATAITTAPQTIAFAQVKKAPLVDAPLEQSTTPATTSQIDQTQTDLKPATQATETKAPEINTHAIPTKINQAQLLSDSVERAQFTSGIKAKEPTNVLNETIFSNGQNTRKIYFFTELKGLTGSTVRHQWYYKRQLVVEIPIHVQGDRWRSYSTKHIPSSMQGKWTVKVQDENENTLTKASFTYKK